MKKLVLVCSLIFAFSCRPPSYLPNEMETSTKRTLDWQGHRGARGLAPENSIPSFLKALSFPEITTLELDVVISKDRKVVVSHEPWISHEICSHPSGEPVLHSEEDDLVLLNMDYAQIASFDCGLRGNPRFPEQEKQKAVKPLLRDLVKAVEAHCASTGRTLPRFNIEIKSRPGWDGIKTPAPAEFARLVIEEIIALNLQDQVCVQSFDPRTLREVHLQAPNLTTALLVESKMISLENHLKIMGYQPQIYSPHFKMVNEETIRMVRQRGMRIIPWTVNETEEMRQLIKLGVDGIITDYPDRIPR